MLLALFVSLAIASEQVNVTACVMMHLLATCRQAGQLDWAALTQEHKSLDCSVFAKYFTGHS